MSSRRPRYESSDRWAELAQEAASRIGGLVRDFVPAEAQLHLLNAQRELLTALFLIYEHQAQARREPAEGRRAVGSRRDGAARLRRIDID
jgi:hypothetical protein